MAEAQSVMREKETFKLFPSAPTVIYHLPPTGAEKGGAR